jgi:hypothetical protein
MTGDIEPESTIIIGCPNTVYWPLGEKCVATASTRAMQATITNKTVIKVEQMLMKYRHALGLRRAAAGVAAAGAGVCTVSVTRVIGFSLTPREAA